MHSNRRWYGLVDLVEAALHLCNCRSLRGKQEYQSLGSNVRAYWFLMFNDHTWSIARAVMHLYVTDFIIQLHREDWRSTWMLDAIVKACVVFPVAVSWLQCVAFTWFAIVNYASHECSLACAARFWRSTDVNPHFGCFHQIMRSLPMSQSQVGLTKAKIRWVLSLLATPHYG